MALLAEIPAPPPRFSLLAFLREELAPRPGRVAACTRIAFNCALTVAIAELYQIPLPAYMAYLVFLISRDEVASTLLTGVAGAIAATLAIALSLVFYMLDASEPALRLPLMAISTYIAMFLSRTMSLGPVAFLAGFIIVLSQTLIDVVPNLEVLTRLILWLWVVVMVPNVLTIVVNLAFGENPAELARRTAKRLLNELAAALRSGDSTRLEKAQAEAVGLVELRQRAGMLDKSLRSRAAIDTMLIETLAELLSLLRVLPAGVPIEARLPLAAACEEATLAFGRGDAPAIMQHTPPDAVLRVLSPEARPVIVAMAKAMTRLSEGIARRRAATGQLAVAEVKSLFVPDAFSNPDHARFALKTMIAVMAAYIIYSLLDWPGISTSVTTCFFVALGSFGETVHKLTLRLAGAAIGGLLGLASIVYVLPHMTDIGQLCLLIAGVSFICGWVATSSERLSYAGMQTAFAFFLGVLHGYGPTTELVGLRDRVVGILLGNLIISIVFSVFWPISALDRARASVAAALRTLSRLLIEPAPAEHGARLAVVRALADARHFVGIAAFELRTLPTRPRRVASDQVSLDILDGLAGATFVVADQEPDAAIAEPVRPSDEAASAWLLSAADRVSKGETAMPAPDRSLDLDRALTQLPADAPMSRRATIEARLLLQAEIENAVAIER
ncbi:FUSC family protein [Methyloferula stellata]|uniref:FUSC family protein n=1 Tax=Methyloferula stellata TaxID=876270 RepID=UPI00037E4877|nr:FUSC family protein [Methyloferula stellata]